MTDPKLWIRKVTITRTYYETATARDPKYIGNRERIFDDSSNVTRRSFGEPKLEVLEPWCEATEPEQVLERYVGTTEEE